ncbi:heme o synthase [Rarobacter faecitabidus]|uniref:Protoheme IX farnesyltransferase n=1 Tax=Rarobacter faecitabidus TaxID=13243 RepID=A0A542ZVZ8_RARFA|nr:heme o synthase [Rarobacter faecitabidus]TQL64492.1 protoheme IX farnesyltransferase [Rarobacter faecitabidus]
MKGHAATASTNAAVGGASAADRPWDRFVGRVGAYVALTKPRVIELLLVATIPTMILAADGFPSFWLVLATLIGGYASAGSSGVFNCYIDRDIDSQMKRTKRRPLATGEISGRAALIFGSILGVFSLAWFWFVVNPLSSILTAGAILLYVVGYSLILKRRTSQNIVWGGAAGCMPVLIGWAAVTNKVEWPAILLFLVIFFWTPPHYWPLSIKFRGDYAAAGVPMLPVVASDRTVATQMIGYTIAMVAATIVLWPVAGLSPVYGVSAILLGAWFTWSCIQLLRRAGHPERGKLDAMRVFHGSITYLSALFVMIAVDVILPW